MNKQKRATFDFKKFTEECLKYEIPTEEYGDDDSERIIVEGVIKGIGRCVEKSFSVVETRSKSKKDVRKS